MGLVLHCSKKKMAPVCTGIKKVGIGLVYTRVKPVFIGVVLQYSKKKKGSSRQSSGLTRVKNVSIGSLCSRVK